MTKTDEYEATVRWAKDAHLDSLINAIVGSCRYPAAIRDELRARLKAAGEDSLTDLVLPYLKEELEVEAKGCLVKQVPYSDIPGAFLIQLRENKDFWRWAKTNEDRGHFAFSNGAEKMWKKCFDPRLTNSPREKLTEGELRLIEAFDSALIGYNIEKEHDFHAFLNEGGE